jgi:hypothetical protein
VELTSASAAGVAQGRQLSVQEAARAFEDMPPQWQLASLHPSMVEIDAKRSGKLRPVYWFFSSGDQRYLHSFLVEENSGLNVADIQSAYGYGGPISNSDDGDFIQSVSAAFGAWADRHGIVAEFLRFHPLVPHEKWYTGSVTENRETVYIDLSVDLFSQYQGRRRTDIKRFMESGMRADRVTPEAMGMYFPKLYDRNMDRVGAAPGYYFSGDYLESLFRFDGCQNWLVLNGDQVIAGAVILMSDNAKVIEYCLAAQAAGPESQRSTIGLLHAVARYYQEKGFRYFYLGGGRSEAADDSLLFFKQGFSPLTSLYKIGSKIHQPAVYSQLKTAFPARASTGRILFYKD